MAGVLRRAAAAGVRSPRGLAAWVAREEGRDPAMVLAEGGEAWAAWRAGRTPGTTVVEVRERTDGPR